jgi:hypothetical protein
MRFKRQKHPCLELLGVACRVSFDLLGWKIKGGAFPKALNMDVCL